jgi:hypothetical protein
MRSDAHSLAAKPMRLMVCADIGLMCVVFVAVGILVRLLALSINI